METLIDFMLIALATWRLTSIINRETIAQPIRNLVGIKLDKNTGMMSWPDSFFAKLIGCFMCLSVWCAGAMFVTYLVVPQLVTILAASTAAIYLEKVK